LHTSQLSCAGRLSQFGRACAPTRPEDVQTKRPRRQAAGRLRHSRPHSVPLRGGRARRRPIASAPLGPHVGERHRRAAVTVRRHT
jgi:hypothetical protein